MDQVRLNTKLAALTGKNKPAIVAEQIHLPKLTRPYDLAQLTIWLDKRILTLEQAKTQTDAQLLQKRTTTYNQCSPAAKLIADKVIAGTQYTLPDSLSDADYDRLIIIILIVYIQ